MAESSWPSPDHNSRAVNDAEYEQLVSPGVASALVGHPSDTNHVYADGSARVVKVRAGKFAMVRGRVWYSGTTDFSVTVAANSSASLRQDLVVLQLDRSTLDITTVVVEGTPGSGPPSPTQATGTTGLYQLPVAIVSVGHNVTVINETDIVWTGFYLAPQDILCTSETRPPASQGRRIYETDTGNEYVSDGTSYGSATEDTNWVEVSAAPGWTKVSGAVRRVNGVTTVLCEVTRSGADLPSGTDNVMMTLPAGHRPSRTIPMLGYFDGANLARALITSDGKITLDNYGALTVSGSKADKNLDVQDGQPFPKASTFTGQPTTYAVG